MKNAEKAVGNMYLKMKTESRPRGNIGVIFMKL